jgi:hypothetical protein
MKRIILILLSATSLAHGYAHDELYKELAEPYSNHCEKRAERAGVSRPDEQILINNCLQDFVIKAARKIQREYPEFAKAQQRDAYMTKYGADEAQQGLRTALHMLENDRLKDPSTEEVMTGHRAQVRLEIELGRRLDQIKSMEDQPGLMDEE